MTNQQTSHTPHPASLAHVTNCFEFMLRAPLSRAAPLFGPEGERCWAGEHWSPRFLHPQPGRDIEGAVFTVQQGPRTSVWVNTIFDLPGGCMQYVSFIPDKAVSVVEVRLTALAPASTLVEVTYARTALNVEANDEVQAMGKMDAASGPHWQQAIEACLETLPIESGDYQR